jgi:hypothetical protein
MSFIQSMKFNLPFRLGAGILIAACLSATAHAQNVGIGVGTPQSKLSINGTTTSGGLAIGDATYTSTSGNVAPVNGAIIQGSVGMGILAPQVALHINGQAYVAGPGVTGQFYAGGANQDGIQLNPGWIGIQRDIGAPLNLAKPGSTTNIQLVNFSIGGPTIGTITTTGSGTGVAYNTTSDERLKENISPSAKGLDELMKIQVSDYNFKSKPGQKQTGFIAQQLYTVLPGAVKRGGEDAAKDPWMVDYGRVTPLLAKAIQDLDRIVKKQQAQIEVLKEQTGRQLVRLKALDDENAKLKVQAHELTDLKADNAELASRMEALEKAVASSHQKSGFALCKGEPTLAD